MESERRGPAPDPAAHAQAGVTFLAPDSHLRGCWRDDRRGHHDRARPPRCAATRRSAPGCVIGPATTITDSTLADGVTAPHSYLVEARVERGATLGPFAYLRPGAHIGEGAKIGTFVEVKNSEIGAGTKVPHLSYIGDADIGENSNIAAGNITANYDGQDKHRTTIGDGVRTGVDTAFVAPVDIGDGAYTGAGSVIREDVPEGRPGDGPVQADQHRGIRRPQEGAQLSSLDTQTAPAPGSYIPAEYDKRLMVAVRAGQPRPGLADRPAAGRGAHRRGPQDVLRRRGLLPLRRLHPRRRPVHRPVHLRLRARGPDGQRRADGAAGHGPRRQARLRPPDHRRDPLVRLLAPGQEVRAARAHHRPAGRRAAGDRRRRPGGHDGPARRPGAGLLLAGRWTT